MFRHHLPRIAAILAVIAALSGCTTTSQPVAQTGSAAKTNKSYYDESPDTGSRIPRRVAVDDTTKKADKTGDNNATNLLVDPTIGGSKPAARGGN